jgi:ABC-2 type transport system permease protein
VSTVEVIWNGVGFRTLLFKEVKRFRNLLSQAVIAPIVAGLLYLLVFTQAMRGRASAYAGVSYAQFLVPGLVMMTIIQNAFANSSQSLIQSKIIGNLAFLLMAPLGALEWFVAYVTAAMLRAALVATALLLATLPFVAVPVRAPGVLLLMFLSAAASLSVLGLIAAIVAREFNQLAAFSNFIVTPMAFLSGVFYTVRALPPFWLHVSHLNPFFYMIDGFRYGFFGVADVPPWQSLLWSGGFFAVLSSGCLWMLATGYRLRH